MRRKQFLSRHTVADMKNKQQGFTLIEILVATFILAIGLLGMAGLQANGLRHNHTAYLRSQATLLAYDIVDRMRSNIAAFNNGDYDLAHLATGYNAGSGHPSCYDTSSTPAGCTDAEMAQNDIWAWSQALAKLLPNGDGVVCIDNNMTTLGTGPAAGDHQCESVAGDTTYVVKVWWHEQDTANRQLFVVSVQL